MQVSKLLTHSEALERPASVGALFYGNSGQNLHDYKRRLFTAQEFPYIDALYDFITSREIKSATLLRDTYPLFSDGTVGVFTEKAWADLLAACYVTFENKKYTWEDFYGQKTRERNL